MTNLRKYKTYLRMATEFNLCDQKMTDLIDLLNDPRFDDSQMNETVRRLLELFGYNESKAQALSNRYEEVEGKVKELQKVEAN